MTSKRRTYLQIPQGTEAFYLEEAFRHRRIVTRLDELFESWGYLPVHTPVFDFFDNYRVLLGEDALESAYRLIDREGDLLMLRADITLFLAKQMGLALKKQDLPIRVYYSDVILRHQNREDISKNEFFQAGVELIGKAGKEADLEVVVLLLRTLKELGVPAVVHVGSRTIFDELFGESDDETQKRLVSAIAVRDRGAVRNLLGRWDSRLVTLVNDLFGFIGTAGELESLIAQTRRVEGLPKGVGVELRRLMEISRTLDRVVGAEAHRIDLSEIGTQQYYTGIVFEAYMQDQDSAIASGGRYDNLLEHFGFPAPSIGFSLLLRKIEGHVSGQERFRLPTPTRATGDSFEAKLESADLLRKKGKISVL
ncbi:MAG TPA: ATP phosphoribosyltransferase regulatory subunit [Spirochaetia bacterium]|nr:ATP phosphoribosyltransferase regulatory subunit [Spirochaetia bacterium]